jgi:hypothetical protein
MARALPSLGAEERTALVEALAVFLARAIGTAEGRALEAQLLGLLRPREPAPVVRLHPRASLSREEHDRAVRSALKHFHSGDRLRDNALARSRLCDVGAPVATLRNALREACASLGESGRDAEHVRVLEATYLDRPRKQRAVADELAMSWSTYRRRLREATERVADVLWASRTSSERSGTRNEPIDP